MKSIFSKIENKNITAEVWHENPFNSEEHFQKKWYIEPISDMQTLTLTFPAPDYKLYYRSKVHLIF